MDEQTPSSRTGLLTEPQRACLRLVATHHNSKEIAHLLGVSPSAVDKRIERAVQVLGARSRFAAARALAVSEGIAFAEPEPVADDSMSDTSDTSERLPCDPIDLPPTAAAPPQTGRDEPWWLVRRLLGLSSPGHRIGERSRNMLSGAQRLGVMMGITLFVAIASMVVLDLAVTLTGVIRHDASTGARFAH